MARRTIPVFVDMPVADLPRNLVDGLTRDQVFAFIKALDEAVNEYEFTRRLHNHFVREWAAINRKDEEPDNA